VKCSVIRQKKICPPTTCYAATRHNGDASRPLAGPRQSFQHSRPAERADGGRAYSNFSQRYLYFCACAFRVAAHRRLVAAMIASLPAVLSLRFFLTGVGGATLAVCDLNSCWVSAHRFRWAALILARVAADTRRVLFAGAAPFAEPPVIICRISAIRASIRFFCSMKPSMAAVNTSLLSLGI
jgi:hypothetical protein